MTGAGASPTSVVTRFIARGKFEPPHREFEPVLPAAAELLTRLSMLPKLVAVSAPPGYGKTVLLSLLHERQVARDHATAWLSLDDRDRTVEALTDLLRTALAHTTGAAAASLRPHEATFAGVDEHHVALLAQLGQVQRPLVVLIDNLHFCDDERLPRLLEQLVFATPPQVRLVLSSTGALPMDLVRAKLELGAQVVAAEQLCLDAVAVRRLFEAAGQPLAAVALADRIVARTEGWPVAVRLLLVLSQQPGARLEDAIEHFSGEHSDIAAVLTRRVFAGFEAALLPFLCELALLREFSAELAAEVTGEPRAAQWIAMLLQRNLLVFPLDSGRRWLRMHTLLRQHLLAESSGQIDRERRRLILEKAARWHAEREDAATAIDLALQAPSYALAAGYLERACRTLVGHQGQLPRFLGWVEQMQRAGAPLPLDTHAWYIWALCFTLRYEEAQHSIQAFDARLAQQQLAPENAAGYAKRLGLLRVVVSVYLDNLDLARREAGAWLADGSEQDALGVATVATAAAIGDIAAHDFVAARWHVDQAAGAIARSDSLYGRAWVACVQACVELWQGAPADADRVISAVRPAALQALGAEAGVVATMDFVHARALADLGRRAEAQAAAARGLLRATQHGVAETARQGLAACIGFWDGDADSPWSPAQLAPVARSLGPRMGVLFDALLVRRLLQLGRADDAACIAERMQPDRARQGLPGGIEVEPSEVALARIDRALASGRQREALAWIDARLALAQARTMRRETVDLHLLAASGHLRHGDDRRALRHLSLAIVHAARRRLVGLFIDQLPLVARLLEVHPDRAFGFTQPDETAFLARLRQWSGVDHALDDPGADARPQGAPAAEPATPQALLSLLTPREVQFLELLGQGLTNQQIADRIGLSVPTVKWHLYNLYGKLTVKNRTAALAVARVQGVLKH